MKSVEEIRIADFDYPLPEERIAPHPLADRDSCRLLLLTPDGSIHHKQFSDIPGLLPEKSLLVCNNTKVINARMLFRKPTGALIEIFLLEPLAPADYALMFQAQGSCDWKCLVGNSKKWKEGPVEKEMEIGGRSVKLSASRLSPDSVRLSWIPQEIPFSEIVEAAGKIPIPPYLNRDSEQSDTEDYQTVYSSVRGSVAAPTAGLHFTPSLLSTLRRRGVGIEEVSLHVGAGTFRPVKAEEIGGHEMHCEHFSVSASTLESIHSALAEGRKIVAVGTTSVRTLESLPYVAAALLRGGKPEVGQWDPYRLEDIPDAAQTMSVILDYLKRNDLDALTASTSIMIAPGFRWRIVDALITNFHQPQSTLLLLVDAFIDRGENRPSTWKRIYSEALSSGYRFLSYGDASLLYPLS